MAKVKPFRAYRPRPEFAATVASPPYDVISSEEARQMARGNELSFLHVGKPEIDLEPSVSLYDDRVYAKGAENLRKLITDGVLVREQTPAYYIYQQRMGEHVQAGLVCAASVAEYEQGLIKRHEHTRKDKEDDRTRHVTETNANAEPVFLTYRAEPRIDAVIDRIRAGQPAYDIVTDDGIGHTLWVATGERELTELTRLFAGVPALYVADGHHRTAAAVRHGQMMRGRNPGGNGDEPYESLMAVLFPHDQLQILDYNRVVADLGGLGEQQLLGKVREKFTVEPASQPKPPRAHTLGMLLGGTWYSLEARPGTFPADHPIESLDVAILQNNLLGPVLGIADPRTDKRIDFVGGIRGTKELEKRCREGAAVAFSMYPTSLEQLMSVADAGEVMPPKSTWFEPKLRSGLTVRLLDE